MYSLSVVWNANRRFTRNGCWMFCRIERSVCVCASWLRLMSAALRSVFIAMSGPSGLPPAPFFCTSITLPNEPLPSTFTSWKSSACGRARGRTHTTPGRHAARGARRAARARVFAHPDLLALGRVKLLVDVDVDARVARVALALVGVARGEASLERLDLLDDFLAALVVRALHDEHFPAREAHAQLGRPALLEAVVLDLREVDGALGARDARGARARAGGRGGQRSRRRRAARLGDRAARTFLTSFCSSGGKDSQKFARSKPLVGA